MSLIITGGFEANFTLGFVRGLVANGVDVCVVSCDDTASRLNVAGIPNVNLRGSLGTNRSVLKKLTNLLLYYLRLIWLVWRRRGCTIHFTGIFRNEFILWEGLVLNSLFRMLAGRYLYTVHNVMPHSREHSRFFRAVYRRIYRIPHRLLVHTRTARNQLIQQFGVPEDRIHLTSIGLNEEMPVTNLVPDMARNRLSFKTDEQVILFFGKIDEYKGLDRLLDAFEQLKLPNSRLLIAGEFRNPAYRMQIHRQMEGLSRKSDIQLHERFIPNDEAEVFFKAADVLCLPYRNIYQSGLIFLAPHFGLPMVATDVGSLREFIGNDLGLVTRTNDVHGLVEALSSFFAAPERFSHAAILKRAETFRWINVCRELLPLYSR